MSTGGIILSLVAGAFIIIILGVPVYASLGLIGTISLVVLTVTKGTPLSWIVVPSSIYNGATQITLLAIPFYVFAGEMMNKGGITKKLVNFALLLIMGMFMDGSAAVIPMITPMNEDGSVDYKSVETFSEYLVQAGADCLYPNGTNGESLLLSCEERQKIAEVIVKTAAGRIPVFIQCGAMSTEETAAHAKHAAESGAEGIGIMTPAFFTMDDDALYNYYCNVISPLPENFPVYIYNIPGCTGNDVKPELLCRLMKKFPNICGIKYSNSDLMRVEKRPGFRKGEFS